MTAAATLNAPVKPPAGDGPDVYHLVCCDPDTSLCGIDVTHIDDQGERPGELLCPMCELVDDEDQPCPGYPDCPIRDRDG